MPWPSTIASCRGSRRGSRRRSSRTRSLDLLERLGRRPDGEQHEDGGERNDLAVRRTQLEAAEMDVSDRGFGQTEESARSEGVEGRPEANGQRRGEPLDAEQRPRVGRNRRAWGRGDGRERRD